MTSVPGDEEFAGPTAQINPGEPVSRASGPSTIGLATDSGRAAVAAILPAAGSGQRLGGDVPKALRRLGGRSLLRRSAERLVAHVSHLVVVAPAGYEQEVNAELTDLGCPTRVVTGGATRQDSVAAGLRALPPQVRVVLVHDAARPLVPAEVVAAVIAAVQGGAVAVVPVLPVADTLKQVSAAGAVTGTVDRSRLVAAQTPQGFRRDVLEQAHISGSDPLTDDAGLVEALGVPVATVPGAARAFKVTTADDLVLAEALLAAGP